ncbi:MAG: HD domain-containing protein [Candidatus Lokiarchaeota archaeon]|nr:HD domain-containing protein [Candidatus Lokiarchaeota archaeon]
MWKSDLLEIVKPLIHPAWGITHFERIYELSILLADMANTVIDKDSLFAAAYLHDIGAFDPYNQKGKDHSEVAVNESEKILKSIDFPREKIALVKDIIKSHMFYTKPSDRIESIIFHDADTLDFLGVIGITRLLAIVGKEDWTPNLKSAIDLIQKFYNELPSKLITLEAKKISKKRKVEMEEFLRNLSQQTDNFNLL